MTRRPATVLASCLLGVYVLAVVTTLVALPTRAGTVDDVLQLQLALGFAVVGALVAVREPSNSVGWLLLTAAVAFGLQGAAEVFARSGAGFGSTLGAWFSAWVWYVWVYSAGLLLPLLFPDGRLLSRRWRVVLAMDLAALVLGVLGVAFGAAALDSSPPIQNPFAAPGLLGDLASGAAVLGGLLALAGFVLGPVSFVLRLRRSAGRERQQLKVFALVVVALAAIIVTVLASPLAGMLFGWRWPADVENIAWAPALLLVIVGVPSAVGVAILRHRLYDIDLVINRSLVYASLTATLAATYVGSVLVLRALLDPFTGGSELAVAGSTLAVAAAFRPARRRIQSVVDRRFYRSSYDAARTLDEFATTLRHQLDLDAVGADLRAAVHATMQPAHVSLWIRP